jgi:hypothetical protein
MDNHTQTEAVDRLLKLLELNIPKIISQQEQLLHQANGSPHVSNGVCSGPLFDEITRCLGREIQYVDCVEDERSSRFQEIIDRTRDQVRVLEALQASEKVFNAIPAVRTITLADDRSTFNRELQEWLTDNLGILNRMWTTLDVDMSKGSGLISDASVTPDEAHIGTLQQAHDEIRRLRTALTVLMVRGRRNRRTRSLKVGVYQHTEPAASKPASSSIETQSPAYNPTSPCYPKYDLEY